MNSSSRDHAQNAGTALEGAMVRIVSAGWHTPDVSEDGSGQFDRSQETFRFTVEVVDGPPNWPLWTAWGALAILHPLPLHAAFSDKSRDEQNNPSEASASPAARQVGGGL